MKGSVRMRKLLAPFALAAVVCLLLCPTPGKAQFFPSEAGNYAAKAVSVSGRVSVMKDTVPWAISVGDTVQVQQLIVTGQDGNALFQLSDGSTFQVYPNSEVLFRKTPGDWRDLLDVLVGRIRVQIQHLMGQPNPNRVLTPTAVISVRGTTFDVEVDEEGNVTTIEVEEGQVEVRHALLPRDNATVLNPGDPPLRVYRNEPIASNTPINKSTIFRYLVQALRDLALTMSTHPGKITIPPGINTGNVGDTCKPGLCPTGGTTGTTGTTGSGGSTGGIPAPPSAPPPPP
jgi:ferric-dicitrate binding protein FerR (iron transport regulator)